MKDNRDQATGSPRRRASPRTLPAEVRRDDLMEAAAGLFVANGIDATTVDDIVARAGVAKGTFYHYFATKNDVIIALRHRFSQAFIMRVAEAVNALPADDFVARLDRWIEAAVAAYLDNFRLHDVVFHEFTHARRQSKEKDDVIGELAELLATGERAGAWSVPNIRATAIVIFDGMHGVVDDAIASGNHDRAQIHQTLSGLLLRMLARP